MTSLPEHLNFHGEDVVPSAPEDSLFHVIPVPLESSVSYGTGTAAGPAAILSASAQLELFTCGAIPAEYGIFTAPPVNCSQAIEEVLKQISAAVTSPLSLHKIPVVLGGEHTVSCGVIPALRQYHEEFGVIQFDAHADLRSSYEGSPLSHACVMRRIHEQGIPIYQLGTRSYSLEEHRYRQQHRIPYRNSEELWKNGHTIVLPDDIPEKVYITFDVDGLDSALLPATGTPVPGGLNWFQAMQLIAQVMEQRICIGFDVVELAPFQQMHAPSFTAAQLVYNIMGYLVQSQHNQLYYGLTPQTY